MWEPLKLSDRYAFLTPDSRQMPFDMFIPLDKLNGAGNGQKAIARLTEWPRHAKNPFGEIIEMLGNQGENETEMHAILAEFGLPFRFSEELEEEASRIADRITEQGLQDPGVISATSLLLPLILKMPRILMMLFRCANFPMETGR